MTSYQTLLAPLALLALAACDGAGQGADPGFVARQSQTAPPGAPPGSCWGKLVSPAVIETVTHQVLDQPAKLAADGTVLSPATYRTETLQEIVKQRREDWFETPCPDQMSTEFISSVQRALNARNLFHGPVNGQMDQRTRDAIRRYQAPQGLDSGTLSLATARHLGLIAEENDNTG